MLVPKRAFTWWAGPEPMTPLHQASVRSFKRWHPDWDVTVHWGEDGPDARRRSDVWRWDQLAAEGGVWFDADVIWYGSIEPHLAEDDMVTLDVGTPSPGGDRVSIGVCAGAAGALVGDFWDRVAGYASEALGACSSDQDTGTEAVIEALADRSTMNPTNLPGRLFYQVPPTHKDMDRLWEPGADVELGGIALHWYGSRYQGEPHPDSPIGRALRKAFA